MKPISIVFVLLVLATSCKKDEEPKPDVNYVGELRLEYSRTFPEFTATATMDVEIDKSGEIYISDPDQVQYSGQDEMNIEGSLIRQNETGTITITSLNGTYKVIDGKEYLSVHASVLIDGTQTTWSYDEDYGWIQVAEIPFSVEDPVENPLEFNIDDAVIGQVGSQLGATVTAAPFGTITYKWILILVVGL